HESNINQVITNIGINTINQVATEISMSIINQAATKIGTNITDQAAAKIAITEISINTINQAATEIGMNVTNQATTKIATNTKIDQIIANMNMDQIAKTDMHNLKFFKTFLKTIKNDYENCGPKLQAALEKLAERYNAAKAKSIPVLTSFLYTRKTESGAKKSNNKENNNPHAILA
ncbi:21362_t:CDS:2, partial [Gigaspora rosea]